MKRWPFIWLAWGLLAMAAYDHWWGPGLDRTTATVYAVGCFFAVAIWWALEKR